MKPTVLAHEQSNQAKQYMFTDMIADLDALHAENLALKKLLCVAAYPRRGTSEEGMTLLEYAARVQTVITHEEAVNLPD